MKRRFRAKILLTAVLGLLLAVGLVLWVGGRKNNPRYESAFVEFIWLAFPPGQALDSFGEQRQSMDSILRQREVGYLAGVTSRGDPPEVVEVELAVSLDLAGGKKLVEEFTARELLPEEITMSAGVYPRKGLLELRKNK